MKVKMYAVITDAVKAATGDLDYSINLYVEPPTVSGWHVLHQVEIDVPDGLLGDIHKQALEKLDAEEKTLRENFESSLMYLKEKRDRLLALPHNPEGS
jgi:hypothetical protein